ncbi:MAG TPA: HTH domain-containing protein, partial [Fibrobacteria bacterium]|nr:HTH domain-containing protein [Fibrobacteria bacterium]
MSKADHLPEILPRRRGIVTASEPASATHMERLMALVMTLLYRRSATVPALAGRFCVSERTIYRDLALLDAAGFPVVSSPGRGGGVGLAKGFRLERQLFSGPALGVWSQSLRALADLSDDSTLDQAADLADGLVPPED